MKLDFSDVKEVKLIPEGDQLLKIIGAKEVKSSNGTEMLVLDMEDAEGGFTRDNICLEGPGAFRAQQFIKAAGIEAEDFEGMEPSDLVGMEINAEIKHEEYNGETRSKVNKYKA